MSKNLYSDGNNCCLLFNNDQVESAKKRWTKERMRKAQPIKKVLSIYQGKAITQLEMNIADVEAKPFNAGGRLYFTLDGYDCWGSAEFCANSQMIVTAAHCVYDSLNGGWAEDIVFYREYANGIAEQVIPIRACVVKSIWVVEEDMTHDYAFCVTDQPCSELVLGYQLDKLKGQVISYGYPTNYYDGEKMMYTVGNVQATTIEEFGTSKFLLMPGNPMEYGASGGAIIAEGTNKIIGIISFMYNDGEAYGIGASVLDKEFQSLLDYAKTWIPKSENSVNSFRLRNKGGFVARMIICWSYTGSDGKASKGTHYVNKDVCVGAERSIQLSETKIPEGAEVWFKVDVVWAKDKTAKEKFVYRKSASRQAKYVISGIATNSKLRFEGVV